ncbi:MAG: hypothetical protein F6K42_26200 [Leptolyngbya sp. SIO1D8]|nr:hypothetical protein [Leptolyngbya sp. SIO1D8]
MTYRLNDPTLEDSFPADSILLPPTLENADCFLADTESGWLSPLLETYRRFMGEPESQSLRCRTVALSLGTSEENRNPLAQGSYAFELEVSWTRQRHDQREAGANFSDQEPRLADRTVVQDVIVAPPDPPVILDFRAAAAAYQVVSRNATDTTEITTSAATNESATSSPSPVAVAPVLLNWTIDNRSEIQTIQIESLAPDGSANTQPIFFEFTNGEIDPELVRYCTSSTEVQLRCENVPTQAEQVGEYTFYLRVITDREDISAEIAKLAPMVAIKPLAPIINSFQVNGIDVLAEPRQVLPLNPALETTPIRLSWQVENAIKIELFPAPGEVEGESINYTISATPGVETIELRATNEAGEVMTRSVVIEKTEAYIPDSFVPLPIFPVPPPPAGTSPVGPPSPPSIEGLEPVRTPPQAD